MKTTKKLLPGLLLLAGLLGSSGNASERAGLVSQGAAFKTTEGWLGLQLQCVGTPDLLRLRVMLDVDGRAHGEPQSGADFMIERGRFFRYPSGAKDWSWDELPPPLALQDEQTLTLIIRDAPFASRVKWHVEFVRSDWSVMGRFPERGELEFDYAAMPAKTPAPRVTPGYADELLALMPRTLSFRLDAEIKDRLWKPDPDIHGFSWKPEGLSSNVSFKVVLADVVSGRTEALAWGEAAVSSNGVRWAGRTLDVDWVLVREELSDGTLRVQGGLSADRERCLRIGVGVEMDLKDWLWHDDLYAARAMAAGAALFENVLPVPWGARGVQSCYPFGVVSSEKGLMIVETDPDEPRSMQISADVSNGFFGVWYDLALTPATSNFPSRAAFQCGFRSESNAVQAFRRAVENFYERYPAFAEGRSSTLELASKSALGLVSAPWTYRLAIPAPFVGDEHDALGLMALTAACGLLGEREAAASALLGCARRADGSRRMAYTTTPAGAKMAVNIDPELPGETNLPLNRALSEWNRLRGILRDPRFAGVCWDLDAASSVLDYNPPSMSVADYPCVYDSTVLRPALATAFAAEDFIVPASRLLRQSGKLSIVKDSMGSHAFFMPSADVIVKSFAVAKDGFYRRADDGRMSQLRTLAGRKPVICLLEGPATGLVAEAATRFLRESLYWGFLPGFGGDKNASIIDLSCPDSLDRSLVKTYRPLAARLVAAGWRPLGPVRADVPDVSVEHYGREESGLRHITLRNTATESRRAVLSIPAAKPGFAVNPLNGAAEWLQAPAGEEFTALSVALLPEEVAVLDLVDFTEASGERTFLKGWNSGAGESTACVKNVESLLSEQAFSAVCRLSWPAPAVSNQQNVFQLEVVNVGTNTLALSDLKLISSRQFRPFEDQTESLLPGMKAVFKGWFTAEEAVGQPWLEVQWGLKRGFSELWCSRLIRPDFVPPVVVRSEAARVQGEKGVAAIRLRVHNHSNKEAEVLVKYEGDFKGGRLEERVALESVKTILLPIRPGRAREGQMYVRAFCAGKQIFQSWYEVSFSGD
ncbi:MAG: hypothetical protein A2X46_11800 [Lentisphaerae bacterium GWF2_57_35]|nr:MAG: hypothetical protein A2X46_11800 [Lentisphaerae bacterium GWF2_57_35]